MEAQLDQIMVELLICEHPRIMIQTLNLEFLEQGSTIAVAQLAATPVKLLRYEQPWIMIQTLYLKDLRQGVTIAVS